MSGWEARTLRILFADGPGYRDAIGATILAFYDVAQRVDEIAGQPGLQQVPRPVLEETWNNYQPGTRRPYGVMEWPALLRKLDRIDPGFRD